MDCKSCVAILKLWTLVIESICSHRWCLIWNSVLKNISSPESNCTSRGEDLVICTTGGEDLIIICVESLCCILETNVRSYINDIYFNLKKIKSVQRLIISCFVKTGFSALPRRCLGGATCFILQQRWSQLGWSISYGETN